VRTDWRMDTLTDAEALELNEALTTATPPGSRRFVEAWRDILSDPPRRAV